MAASETDVVIIGGGAAGLAAARTLVAARVDCRLLEARDRLGGRAWTVDAGAPIDLGCGWLHSADRNPWSDIAATRGFSIERTPPPWTRPSLPVDAATDGFGEAIAAFYERVDALHDIVPDRPAAAALQPGERWNALIDAVATFVTGGTLDQVSVRDLARYDDSGVNWRVIEGYGALIVAQGPGLPVALGCAVRRIDHSARRLRIDTTQGTITAGAAIVTLPTSLIAEHESLFVPALPDKAAAAHGLPLGSNDKLFLSLDRTEAFAPDSMLFGHSDTSRTVGYHVRPFGRPMIECYFGGPLAAELEAGGIAAFHDFASGELTGLLGHDFARRISPLHLHPWGTDPFARGAYSYARPGHADDRAKLAAPVDDRLFFAGEACSPHDFSTAHGAWLTGIEAAKAAIAALRGGRS